MSLGKTKQKTTKHQKIEQNETYVSPCNFFVIYLLYSVSFLL